ncbi:MAG: alpha/beta hydrolase [Hyphomicrobium sp.]
MARLRHRSKFAVLTDGTRLHYVEAGAGPTLLMVPGWMGSVEYWTDQIEALAASHRVIALDPRSHGRSEQTADGNSIAQRGADIWNLIERLDLAPTGIVAWSLAVADVLSMVKERGTGHVRQLILVDGPIVSWTLQPEMLQRWMQQLRVLQQNRPQFVEDWTKRMFKRPPDPVRLARLVKEAMKVPTNTSLAIQMDSLDFDYRETLRSLDRPTMYIGRGETPGTQFDMFTQLLPEAPTVVFPGCGHAMFMDDPRRFNELVREFCS